MAGKSEHPVSGRVQLARLAEEVIDLTEAVRGTDGADGRWMTADGDRQITGVLAAVDGLGQIEIELHLLALWPPEPFERLGEDLRRRLRGSAGMAGLGDCLGAVQVSFHDILIPDGQTSP